MANLPVKNVVKLGLDKPEPLYGHISVRGVPVWRTYEVEFDPDRMFHIHPGEKIIITIPWRDFWGAEHGYPTVQGNIDG